MKQFKIIGIISLVIFSFFLTDIVTDIAINNNNLMKVIRNKSDYYTEKSVNAIIENNTIIPGIKGKEIDEIESYLNMKDFGAFNENYLVYKSVKPKISLDDNKNKVIISGNKTIRNVSVLINNNQEIIDYSKKNNIKYTKLTKMSDNLDNIDNVNIESYRDGFKDLDTLLNKKNINKKICLINYSNIEECVINNYYLVKYNLELNNKNIQYSLNDVENGSIIFLDDNLTVKNYMLLVKYVNNKDMNFVYLSDLIKE